MNWAGDRGFAGAAADAEPVTTTGRQEEVTSRARHLGRALRRREDWRYLVGHARYTDDIVVPGALHVTFLRSPHAHARLVTIDVSQARASAGVVAVRTGRDLDDRLAPLPCNFIVPGTRVPRRRVLAKDRVRHVGDPIAAVVAESPSAARDAVERIIVEYALLDSVVSAEAALQPGAPLVHDEIPQNRAVRWAVRAGDFARAVTDSDLHIKYRLINQRLVPMPLEPRAVIAVPERGTGELTVYTATQAPHLIRRLLAETLHFPEHRLRVIVHDVGGGFGSKLHLYPEEALCAFLALELGRPIRWTESRTESTLATTHGRDQIQDVEVAARRDGVITGLKVTAYANLGAYLSTMGPGIPTVNFAAMLSGAYRIANLDVSVHGALTNTTPVDTYRGAGRPEAAYLVERAIDLVAAALRLDPADVRRRNFVPREAFPFTTATGMTYDSGDYLRALEVALRKLDYSELREHQGRLRSEGRYIGIGFSAYVEFCGMAPSRVLGRVGLDRGGWESALVRVHPSGKVSVFCGAASQGQGHETTFAQIVADSLGVPLGDVEIVQGDTGRVQFGNGTFGSRSMPVAGPALKRAAEKVLDKARKVAAHLLEAAEGDVEFAGGRFTVRGATDRCVSFADVSLAAHLAHRYPADLEPGLEASSFYDPSGFTSSSGTHVAVVEVDPETGAVRLVRYVAVDDCGNVVNPLLAAGQVHGGVAQGIGQALLEGAVYDAEGQLATGSLMDYALARASDLPSFETAHTVTPSPFNSLGVKGLGEAGAVGAPPAVVNAVLDALAPFGVTQLDMPLTAEKVWQAIRRAAAGGEPIR